MTREEAIKIVRNIYQTDAEKEALAVLIPELRESEDERIRKGLIKMISNIDGGHPFENYGIIKKEALAWLEKQKEQKSSELSEEEESQIWQIANNAAKTFDEAFAILTATKKAYNKGRKDAVKEQNPAEWSEEDEEMQNVCINACRYLVENFENSTEQYQKGIEWLKSLRPSWKPSENIDVYELAYERYPINNRLVREVTKDINEDTRDGFIDGYKYCNSNSWKPSEEQMEALSDTLEFMPDTFKPRCTLVTLQNDLKKLL